MPVLYVRLEADELEAIRGAAKAASLPASSWARSQLVKLAAPQARNAESKPVGRPSKQDEWLDKFANARFPSGQRRYRFLIEEYPSLADDEEAHRLNELDLLASRHLPVIKKRPLLWAYHEKVRNRT